MVEIVVVLGLGLRMRRAFLRVRLSTVWLGDDWLIEGLLKTRFFCCIRSWHGIQGLRERVLEEQMHNSAWFANT